MTCSRHCESNAFEIEIRQLSRKLAATQAEVQLLQQECAKLASQRACEMIDKKKAQAEARELRAELARVRELCPEVLAFAHLMQRKLDANAHKDGQGWDRDGTGKRGWKNCDVSFLRGKLTDEVVELIVAIREPTNHDNVAEEAADVGNIAMMLADVCGALSQPAEYRLLTRADKIEATDELLRDDCVTWAPVAGDLCKGMQYNPDLFVPVRRRVGAAPAAQEGRDDA